MQIHRNIFQVTRRGHEWPEASESNDKNPINYLSIKKMTMNILRVTNWNSLCQSGPSVRVPGACVACHHL
jgi:hypothetical protein